MRDYLEQEALLERKEKDALAQVYGLLSETGAHPYIAKSDQARLLRHRSGKSLSRRFTSSRHSRALRLRQFGFS